MSLSGNFWGKGGEKFRTIKEWVRFFEVPPYVSSECGPQDVWERDLVDAGKSVGSILCAEYFYHEKYKS